MAEKITENCPELALANGYKTIPPAACRRGFAPEVVKGVVFADNRCPLVDKGLTNQNCQKITKEEIQHGSASPEILAKPRIIYKK